MQLALNIEGDCNAAKLHDWQKECQQVQTVTSQSSCQGRDTTGVASSSAESTIAGRLCVCKDGADHMGGGSCGSVNRKSPMDFIGRIAIRQDRQ
jgi:hypothetical protein